MKRDVSSVFSSFFFVLLPVAPIKVTVSSYDVVVFPLHHQVFIFYVFVALRYYFPPFPEGHVLAHLNRDMSSSLSSPFEWDLAHVPLIAMRIA